jgi:hypothetical protein
VNNVAHRSDPTFIGTGGRLENAGDTGGGVVKVTNRRYQGQVTGDREHLVAGGASGHEDADLLTMIEFLNHVVDGTPTIVSALAAREAVAAVALAARSLREGSRPIDVPQLPDEVTARFTRTTTSTLSGRNAR